MKQTTTITCPHCSKKQELDLYDHTDSSDMEGQFELDCEECEKEFTVKFEFRAYINIEKK